MYKKTELQSLVQETVKSENNIAAETKEKIELDQKDKNKLVIQLNLGNQNFHKDEVTQIIREIFELSNHAVEVEKVVLPTGESKWQVKKVGYSGEKEDIHLPQSSSMQLTDKERRLSGTKLVKYNKLCKIRSLRSLSRLRHGLRKKVSEKLSPESESSNIDMPEVHSSSAITNLLSQLYPNPYSLISLLEVENKSNSLESKVVASDSCKISFKAKDGLNKESEQEFAAPDTFCSNGHDKEVDKWVPGVMVEGKSSGKNCVEKRESLTVSDLFILTGTTEMQTKVKDVGNVGSRKVKRMKITSEEMQVGANDVNSSQEHPGNKNRKENRMESSVRAQTNHKILDANYNRKGNKTRQSNVSERNALKIVKPTIEKMEEEQFKKILIESLEPYGEMLCISKVQEIPLQRMKKEKEKSKLQQASKKKYVIEYLKLIRDIYEQEERCLKTKIDDAFFIVIDQEEKSRKHSTKAPGKRKTQKTVQKEVQEEENKNSKLQTPGPKKMTLQKKISTQTLQENEESTELARTTVSDDSGLGLPKTELSQNNYMIISEPQTPLLKQANNVRPKPSGSQLHDHQKICQMAVFKNTCNNFGLVNRTPNTIRTDTFVFSSKIRKHVSSETKGLPIEVINRNALETNRKIDLLIKHIDKSMDWLSQTENAKPSNINSLIEKGRNLSEQLEANLGKQKPGLVAFSDRSSESLRINENKKLSYSNSGLLLSPSCNSIHIFPVDRVDRMGSMRIQTSALFSNDMRHQDSLWLGHTNSRSPPPSNIMIPHSRSADFITPENNGIMPNIGISVYGQERAFLRGTIGSEIPELGTSTEPELVFVENANELGGFAEDTNYMDQCRRSISECRKIGRPRVSNQPNSNLFKMDSESSSPSSLSISTISLNDSTSALKPAVMQEITWSSPVPVSSSVMKMHYLNERHMVFTIMEVSVFHVATTVYFMDLVLISDSQVLEQERKQQSSIIILLHECSSFMKNNDGLDQSEQVCKFSILPNDANFTERDSGNTVVSDKEIHDMNIEVLKGARSGSGRERKETERYNWEPLLSEKLMGVYGIDQAGIDELDDVLKRPNEDVTYGENLEWLDPIDQYKSNPADDDTGTPNMKQINLHPINKASLQGCVRDTETKLFPDLNSWNCRHMKFSDSVSPLFRYHSSETSITSVDERNLNITLNMGEKDDQILRAKKFSNVNTSFLLDTKKTDIKANPIEQNKNEKQEDDDSSSTSSFKSSNDFSDINDLLELRYSKKRPKSKSHFLDKLFYELRSFRKCLTRQRGLKRETAQDDSNEFQDALSEVNMEFEEENKFVMSGEKQAANEGVLVNNVCFEQVGKHAIPRKIFKTSFRGKKSVTELMIDFKDVSISEVSDISVEKRKLSTDHTKISISISKQPEGNAAICYTNQGYKKREKRPPSREDSCHSVKSTTKGNCLDWNKDVRKSNNEANDDDYKSVDSHTETRSLENGPDTKSQDDTDLRDKLSPWDSQIEPRKKGKLVRKQKFDFYKKMENTSFNGSELLYSNYEKEIAPLRKTLADMQFRIHNIQKKTFCTSDEYYERALRMAKMSAGYCQLCNSKTVIPKDPLGIYQNLIPRTNPRNPYSNHKKYYFKTNSSTNSSFYSIRSSNIDVSDKFCHMNNSSSIMTNGLGKNRGPVLQESGSSNIPLIFGRTLHF